MNLEKLKEYIIKGNNTEALKITQEALNNNIPASIILNEHLIPAMEQVGKYYEEGKFYLPQMLISARAMKYCIDIIKPYLIKNKIKSKGRVVIGTIIGDMHDIGKNLVKFMLEGNGFETIDLGNNVEPSKFVNVAIENNADIIAMSALLTTTMLNMKKVIEYSEQKHIRDKFKIIIGGAPVNQAFADEIKADAYGKDAYAAVNIAKDLLS